MAFSHALANCKGEIGCVTGVQAGLYSGAFRDPQQDTIVGVAVAMLPWGRLILDGLALYRSGTGGGGNGIIVDGNNNQFIGFNKLIADKGGAIYSPFDTTAAPSLAQSWADMYNQNIDQENFRNQQNQ